jgi:hypothetical protein
MKIFNFLKRKSKKNISKQSEKYYSEIDDFILWNWDKCQQGDIRWVNRDGVETDKDFEHFELLQDQYIARYDLQESVKQYLQTLMDLTELRLLYIETGDRSLLNQIEIETENKNKLDPSKIKGMTIDESLAWLRTQMPRWINKKKITIVDFRDLMNEYGRRNKKG